MLHDDRHRLWLNDVAVLVLAALLFSLGTHAQLWDRDEPRYAEASRQMLQSGDIIVPVYNGEPRYKKPPGIYWLMAISYAAFGVSEFAARFPAVLFSAITCLLIFRFVRIRTGRLRAAWLSVAAFALCPMTMIQAGAATTDAVLLTLITGLLLGWLHLTAAESGRRRLTERTAGWVVWYAVLGLALLVKFPVPIAALGMAGILYYGTDLRELVRLWRRVRCDWFGHALGSGVLTLVILPWLIAAWVQTDGDYLQVLIFNEVLERSAVAQEAHGGPFFYYLIVLPVLWLPWPLLLWLSWRRVPESLDRVATRWLVCAAAGTVLIFSAVSTKLPHYIYPAYPPLAMLAGVALDRALSRHHGLGPAVVRMRDGWGWWRQVARVGVAVICWLTVVAGMLLPLGVALAGSYTSGALDPILPVAALCGLVLVIAADRVASGVFGRHWPRVVGGAALGTLVFCLVARGLLMPGLDAIKPSQTIADEMHAVDPDVEGETLHCFGYAEDSLTFYTHCLVEWHRGGPPWQSTGPEFWQWIDRLAADSPGGRMWMLMQVVKQEGAWQSLQDTRGALRAADVPLALRRLCRIGPFLHYNRGRDQVYGLELWLCQRTPEAP